MKRATAVVFLLAVLGCGTDPADGPTRIRLVNQAGVPMEAVVVTFPSSTEDYGTIAPGAATDYRAVGQAYRYAKIEATIEGQPAIILPIDYVGEELLGRGDFEYVLGYDPTATSPYGRLLLLRYAGE